MLRRKGVLQVGHFADSVLCDEISILRRWSLCLDLEQGCPTRWMHELYFALCCGPLTCSLNHVRTYVLTPYSTVLLDKL